MISKNKAAASLKTSTNRTKLQNFLRKLVRRRPCLYVLLGNITLLVAQVAVIVLVMYIIIKSKNNLNRFKAEDVIVQQRQDEITFHHCSYESKPSPFYTDYCIDNYGSSAVAWREFKLRADNTDPTCLDWREQVECHDNKIIDIERIEEYPECAGIFGVPMPIDDFSDSRGNVIAPAVDNEKIKLYRDQNVLASQLVIHCPRCDAQTGQFKFKGDMHYQCYRKLYTASTGWPSDFYFCDLFEDYSAVYESLNKTCPGGTIDMLNPFS